MALAPFFERFRLCLQATQGYDLSSVQGGSITQWLVSGQLCSKLGGEVHCNRHCRHVILLYHRPDVHNMNNGNVRHSGWCDTVSLLATTCRLRIRHAAVAHHKHHSGLSVTNPVHVAGKYVFACAFNSSHFTCTSCVRAPASTVLNWHGVVPANPPPCRCPRLADRIRCRLCQSASSRHRTQGCSSRHCSSIQRWTFLTSKRTQPVSFTHICSAFAADRPVFALGCLLHCRRERAHCVLIP